MDQLLVFECNSGTHPNRVWLRKRAYSQCVTKNDLVFQIKTARVPTRVFAPSTYLAAMGSAYMQTVHNPVSQDIYGGKPLRLFYQRTAAGDLHCLGRVTRIQGTVFFYAAQNHQAAVNVYVEYAKHARTALRIVRKLCPSLSLK